MKKTSSSPCARFTLLISPLLLPFIAGAQETLVVSAAPQAALPVLDMPAAVNVVYGDDMRRATPRVNLSESLHGIPGLQVQNRQNYAQDLQLSIRGFGARSTYGVRGIRLYVDGIPATMPDGQGQTSNIDINSADAISVLRGPFSALYGNASGGIIDVKTQAGRQPNSLEAGTWYGSFGSWRNEAKASGATGDGTQAGDMNYTLSASRFTTHGFRERSSARKNLGNARLGIKLDNAAKLTLILNSVDIAAADPGGLGYQEWRAAPRQAPRAAKYNTRKTIGQRQMGLRYDRQISKRDDFSLSTWVGQRATTQYQSIPQAPQRNPGHAGGVISLARRYQGIDARWTHRGELGVPVSVTGGLDVETLNEKRKGYENYISNDTVPTFGKKGKLRRNERNLIWNLDPYLQTSWQLARTLTFDAGARYSAIRFDSNDRYITPGNGDDSGAVHYRAWLPAGALKYAATDAWNLYVTGGRGFETPTFNELSYRDDGTSGLNTALKPSDSTTWEIGSKSRIGNGLFTAALFQTDTDNDIVVSRNIGGRSTYKNAGVTRRRGVELGLERRFADNGQVTLAWTRLDAIWRSNVCQRGDCNGKRIPGIARSMGFVSLAWAPEAGWYASASLRYTGSVEANDANTARAPSYTTAGLNTGYKWLHKAWTFDLFSHIDNLFDKIYAGSVIVNEGNGRYYEPAPGRHYGIGATVSYQFE
ncbi:TonB-dependent receptor [Enterobacteriaceae bacterium YMB-R22]|jgi:iron complex outermembrane receptor protein|uniref:TonB-dependent receptor PqqU n=1 Tax=Tenebrionicola larvae TaxID=2815733 RepID=UPI002011E191|nr:TonB-dependent receptor PqqU [Tenebrionicola larvae]MBV4411316.1 TonB-dependent receptor [Tenebrionicola larvae]